LKGLELQVSKIFRKYVSSLINLFIQKNPGILLNWAALFLLSVFFGVGCSSNGNHSGSKNAPNAKVQGPSPVDPQNPPQIRIEGIAADALYEEGSLIKILVSNYPVGKAWQGFELVLNDGEPERFYESRIDYKLPVAKLRKGANLLKAYLVRSWGEAVKNREAFAYVPFFFESKGLSWVAPGRPIVTLVSPRGEYRGEDAKKVLFDFLVHTAGAEEKTWKVHYNLNGSKLELSSGKAYYFNDLASGDYELKVEAVNSRGIPLGQVVTRSRSSFQIIQETEDEKNNN